MLPAPGSGASQVLAGLLIRWGWQQHKLQRWHRNYIKRFYGAYPEGKLGVVPR